MITPAFNVRLLGKALAENLVAGGLRFGGRCVVSGETHSAKELNGIRIVAQHSQNQLLHLIVAGATLQSANKKATDAFALVVLFDLQLVAGREGGEHSGYYSVKRSAR